jgi:hypothetical protein
MFHGWERRNKTWLRIKVLRRSMVSSAERVAEIINTSKHSFKNLMQRSNFGRQYYNRYRENSP